MLKGMVALVTGAAGSLGSATTKKLISEGCKVVMIDLPRSNGKELAESFGENALFCAADVTSETEITNAVQTIKDQYGQLNVLVNCASLVMTKMLYNINSKQSCDFERMMTSLSTNIGGTLNVIKMALDLMVESPLDEDSLRGVIINTSGFGAYDGQMGQSIMSASWGAISSLTLPLCRELGPAGIRVMGIAPGLIESNLTNFIKRRALVGLKMFIPAPKRLGHPEEYADLVLNIIQNKYLNGEVIRLDGGLRLNLT